MLWGPYVGETYTGELQLLPVSSLELPGVNLEVHQVPGLENAILVCRSVSGHILSQTALIPTRTDENSQTIPPSISEMELVSVYHPIRLTNETVCVYVHCDWEWGGREGGLLFLDENFNFKELWLSW